MEYDLLIREAEIEDSEKLISFLDQVSVETDFTTLDPEGIMLTEPEMAEFIKKQAQATNQIILLALLNDELAGLLSITADKRLRVRHIGDVFLVVQKRFSNQGLGTILLEEGLEWAKRSNVLRRLQLSVQTRNEAAVHLYEKMGFVIEGKQERGAYLEEGTFLDVYLMGKLIDA